MAAGERLLAAARKAFFGPLRVSVMLDSNGSNTTAVAAVAKLQQAAGSLEGRRVVVCGGSGPVGMRAAGLLARAGAEVAVTSRRPQNGALEEGIRQRFGGTVREVVMPDSSHASAVLEGAELLLNAGLAGVRLVPRDAWARRPGLRAAADLNAVPPAGIEGIEPNDDGVEREGTLAFGALGVGKLKMKIHRACIARLFEQNDSVLDAETIAEVAREIAPSLR
jgi:NAD(P)-dependent dehydrogenase (short-subunit alcohol dehydrogenase family)